MPELAQRVSCQLGPALSGKDPLAITHNASHLLGSCKVGEIPDMGAHDIGLAFRHLDGAANESRLVLLAELLFPGTVQTIGELVGQPDGFVRVYELVTDLFSPD